MSRHRLTVSFVVLLLAASWLVAQQTASNGPTPAGITGRYQVHEFSYQVGGQPLLLRIDTATGVTHRYEFKKSQDVWERVVELPDQPNQ